jgi:hypothetical protein
MQLEYAWYRLDWFHVQDNTTPSKSFQFGNRLDRHELKWPLALSFSFILKNIWDIFSKNFKSLHTCKAKKLRMAIFFPYCKYKNTKSDSSTPLQDLIIAMSKLSEFNHHSKTSIRIIQYWNIINSFRMIIAQPSNRLTSANQIDTRNKNTDLTDILWKIQNCENFQNISKQFDKKLQYFPKAVRKYKDSYKKNNGDYVLCFH